MAFGGCVVVEILTEYFRVYLAKILYEPRYKSNKDVALWKIGKNTQLRACCATLVGI